MRSYDRLYIGGDWVIPHSGRRIASIDPSTEMVWAEIAEADEKDIDNAVEAAKAAMRGPWKTKITPTQRGALLLKLADLVHRDAAKLAELESRDNGKPLRDTVGEVQRAVDWLTYFAGAADKIQGEQIPIRANALAYTRREPVGVVGAVLPWNSPILLYSWKMGPALAAGNAMVLKPAEQTPVTALEIAKLVAEAGFPAGVFNVVPGYGTIAGAALAAHRGVNKISFTGSHATARKIMQLASGNLKRCTFECGGKSPHVIFADADLERALVVATQSAFRSTGQSCSLGSRLFVQRPIYAHSSTESRRVHAPSGSACRSIARPISGRRHRPNSSPRPNITSRWASRRARVWSPAVSGRKALPKAISSSRRSSPMSTIARGLRRK